MIGLDTNILLRYFTQDDPAQFMIARELIEERLTAENPGFMSLVTIVELAWTLKTRFKLSNALIASMIDHLLSAHKLVLQNQYEVFLCVVALEDDKDFADSLIAALGTSAGCAHTLTFDRKASRLPGMQLI
jgi:predicted nucleic-acid-binding protein